MISKIRICLILILFTFSSSMVWAGSHWLCGSESALGKELYSQVDEAAEISGRDFQTLADQRPMFSDFFWSQESKERRDAVIELDLSIAVEGTYKEIAEQGLLKSSEMVRRFRKRRDDKGYLKVIEGDVFDTEFITPENPINTGQYFVGFTEELHTPIKAGVGEVITSLQALTVDPRYPNRKQTHLNRAWKKYLETIKDLRRGLDLIEKKALDQRENHELGKTDFARNQFYYRHLRHRFNIFQLEINKRHRDLLKVVEEMFEDVCGPRKKEGEERREASGDSTSFA